MLLNASYVLSKSISPIYYINFFSEIIVKLRKLIMGLLLITMAFSLTSMALDTKVYTLCENNLSINLTPEFKIVPSEDSASSNGIFAQSFTIANGHSKGMAILSIMDVYDEDMILFGPEYISNAWLTGINLATSLLSGDDQYKDQIICNWYALDSMGNNVTVSTISTNGSIMSSFGKTVDASNWNIGGNKYAGLYSFFDKNTTEQIIGSLKLS